MKEEEEERRREKKRKKREAEKREERRREIEKVREVNKKHLHVSRRIFPTNWPTS